MMIELLPDLSAPARRDYSLKSAARAFHSASKQVSSMWPPLGGPSLTLL
jgi:hypothetical protein